MTKCHTVNLNTTIFTIQVLYLWILQTRYVSFHPFAGLLLIYIHIKFTTRLSAIICQLSTYMYNVGVPLHCKVHYLLLGKLLSKTLLNLHVTAFFQHVHLNIKWNTKHLNCQSIGLQGTCNTQSNIIESFHLTCM